MTIATLTDVLQPAMQQGYAVAGLVTLGWEDMRAYVSAAEEENVAIILQAGPSCRSHTPLPILGKMFNHLASEASVPVVAHLDHGYTEEECKEAIDCGFTSVMFDGSRLSLQENIDRRLFRWRKIKRHEPIRSKNICKRYKSRRNGNIRWKRSFTKTQRGQTRLGADQTYRAGNLNTVSDPWRIRSAGKTTIFFIKKFKNM